ncbi:5-keto-4-deoxy-D-glucarate aldolase [Thalassoglobus neptunius]|uniref:5-keto-4-deoxy-D-glucarate aldolase n=1 Tax=Thalassoglobus neptunius TaxID=1938619 RepID=A0A5C5WWU6_9PLAN|nr:aldolase/citrate lyase family protein [Thalassoglobus neptunius]TWT55424.1 5-keto-4-deoxy-D-glucarate aldolase [Thalassoglobus neptunius]
MRRSRTLAKIRAGETARMCALGHYIPAYIKHAANAGYDCIWLDTEHRQLEDHQIQSLLAFGHLFDIDIMVRARTLEKTRLYRLLEDGATGLMIPHVSTPEKAATLVDAVKFPPIGDRGLDGAGLDADFLCNDPMTFPEEANRETFLVVQIETPQAVENVEQIAATDGVDVLFIGPGDLGLRLRHQETGWSLEDAYQRTAEACKKHGKAWACPVSGKEEIQKRREQGAQLLAHGGDFLGLKRMLETNIQDFEE